MFKTRSDNILFITYYRHVFFFFLINATAYTKNSVPLKTMSESYNCFQYKHFGHIRSCDFTEEGNCLVLNPHPSHPRDGVRTTVFTKKKKKTITKNKSPTRDLALLDRTVRRISSDLPSCSCFHIPSRVVPRVSSFVYAIRIYTNGLQVRIIILNYRPGFYLILCVPFLGFVLSRTGERDSWPPRV